MKDDRPVYEEIVDHPHFVKLREVPKEAEAKSYTLDDIHVFIQYTLEGDIPLIHGIVLHTTNPERSPYLNTLSNLLGILFRANVPYGVILSALRESKEPLSENVANIIQQFLAEFGVMEPPEKDISKQETILTFTLEAPSKQKHESSDLAVCPVCGEKTLVVENGCYTCINPECGWSKCEL